jgi:hypothetical protein
MKRILFNLLPAIFLWLSICCRAIAQDVAQSDQITDDQQIIQDDSSSTGKFEPVAVDPSASSDVALQFPLSLASKPVVVQPLDGGVLQIGNSVIDQNGLLSFSFQVTDQPGVHRVIVIDPNADEDSTHIIGMVQFEVPNPAE